MENNNYKIYRYTSPSGGVYIGQTKYDIEERARHNGRCYMVLNKKTGKFMQPSIANAILKYGWDNFKKEILYEGLTSEEADNMEKKLISEAKKNGVCYNIAKGGKHVINNNRQTKVSQYKLNGEYVKTWDSIKEAEISLGIKKAQANIVSCCSGLKNRAYGYIWRYGDQRYDVKPLTPYREPICQFSKTGEYIQTYKTIKEASLATKIHENGIGNALHGRAKTAGNFVWKFKNDCDNFF